MGNNHIDAIQLLPRRGQLDEYIEGQTDEGTPPSVAPVETWAKICERLGVDPEEQHEPTEEEEEWFALMEHLNYGTPLPPPDTGTQQPGHSDVEQITPNCSAEDDDNTSAETDADTTMGCTMSSIDNISIDDIPDDGADKARRRRGGHQRRARG